MTIAHAIADALRHDPVCFVSPKGNSLAQLCRKLEATEEADTIGNTRHYRYSFGDGSAILATDTRWCVETPGQPWRMT